MVDVSAVVTISGSIVAATGITIRGLLIFLDRQGDRRLARHVFDQTKSTDALAGYTKLRLAQRPRLGRRKAAGKDDDAVPPVLPPGGADKRESDDQ